MKSKNRSFIFNVLENSMFEFKLIIAGISSSWTKQRYFRKLIASIDTNWMRNVSQSRCWLEESTSLAKEFFFFKPFKLSFKNLVDEWMSDRLCRYITNEVVKISLLSIFGFCIKRTRYFIERLFYVCSLNACDWTILYSMGQGI